MAAVASNRVVGMMDSAYFVGRKVILDWLNDLLQLRLAKIEETATGAVACQVMDALFPGNVAMSKVNWGAKTDYEYVQNYKVLQQAFVKLKVDKQVEVDRLIRARYQDNLEFMQWLRAFYEQNEGNLQEDYDAVGRRNLGKGVSSYKPAMGGAPAKKPAARRPSPATTGKPAPRSTKQKENAREINKGSDGKRGGASMAELKAAKDKTIELDGQVQDLQNSNADLKLQVEDLERERDFYFAKLREVEVLLQNYRGADREIVRDILKVLYATEDDVDGEAALAAAEAAMAEPSEDGDQAGEAKADAEGDAEEKATADGADTSEQQQQQQFQEEY
ncbi:Microtubule-associated protein RP/EB family member 1B (APC-binding protein EB1B) (End-binding protein 1) (AtEB1) (End-binding protein 1B) (AtEB1B) (Protein ATEB1 homolog 2) (ATEB1H2) [Durusdinium trenchii]|uniref:Microtubule-associated protein RP/EB family member 1B (APC-binding protein EB1B) (End-binding protein 1) (AtEB1) (End-binding protein 1B) (AtEB1B) (Protein ATEB1 homolog 2) (ATEB1H2) n=1 Tax=Durusdinium trenchii TaxID=1381693 RepID=A0ABP0NJK8_9DINO